MCEIPAQSSFIKTLKAWLDCNVAMCVVLDAFDFPCPIGLYVQTYMKYDCDFLETTP